MIKSWLLFIRSVTSIDICGKIKEMLIIMGLGSNFDGIEI